MPSFDGDMWRSLEMDHPFVSTPVSSDGGWVNNSCVPLHKDATKFPWFISELISSIVRKFSLISNPIPSYGYIRQPFFFFIFAFVTTFLKAFEIHFNMPHLEYPSRYSSSQNCKWNKICCAQNMDAFSEQPNFNLEKNIK